MPLMATLLLFTLGTSPAPKAPHPFTVYGFLPWREHVVEGRATGQPALQLYLAEVGVRPVRVIYDFLSNGAPDSAKIRAIAEAAATDPEIPVSFDTEFGDRFKPETVIPGVTEILRRFRETNRTNPVGVYATLPQNSYGGRADPGPFIALNRRYAMIASLVDFLSPVLYNYDGHDLALWRKSAEHGMSEAHKYAQGKRVLPYLSPVVLTGKATGVVAGTVVEELSEAEMTARLQALYDLGADGCIVWASSQARLADGRMPVFNGAAGWGKAVVAFAAAHR